jgi:hypothetical protein
LEQLAEIASTDHRRAKLYFQAGDRHYASNPAEALRCYRQALDAGTEVDWQVNERDNYLLAILKIERLKKENR